MVDYSTGYASRMVRNDAKFRELAEELKSKGCQVYATKDGLISFMYIVKDGYHICVGFGEVPYRWTLSYDIETYSGSGSCKTLCERSANPIVDPNVGDIYNANEILAALHKNPSRFNLNYLKEL